MLPKEIPDSINCKDALGRKQGWWIYYKVLYNPVEKPDVLASGKYVPSYSYGKYKDGRRIGIWKEINNVHAICRTASDSYLYSGDTLYIHTHLEGRDDYTLTYIGDSAIAEYDKRNSK